MCSCWEVVLSGNSCSDTHLLGVARGGAYWADSRNMSQGA